MTDNQKMLKGYPRWLLLALVLLTVVSFAFVYVTSTFGIGKGIAVLAILVGAPVAYLIVAYPKLGIVILLIAAYFIMWFIRMGVNFPLGTLMDGIEFLLILGFFIFQKRSYNWIIYKNPITYVIIIWITYNLLQFFNPVAESQLAWLYTIRSVAIVMLMYFVFVYHINTLAFVRLIFKIWITLAIFGALYAFKQEYYGFFQFEENYLNSDPNIRQLLFIAGRWRKFSIYSDPVSFSFNMAISAMFCIVLATTSIRNYKKVLLILLAGFFSLSMLFSGTRAAYVLLPIGILLLGILKFNTKILIYVGLMLGIFLFLVFVPTGNQNIVRFQSAFKPSEDASYNVREINQKRIQPFIQSHPFGGGLGATGTWGERFAPHSYLAKFPPDSGYVRVAVELGYVGLFLFCTLMFVILKTGIKNYYRIKDPELKAYCLSATLIVFILHIANFPQEAIVQFPTNIYFYLFVALINVTHQLDKQKSENSKLLKDGY